MDTSRDAQRRSGSGSAVLARLRPIAKVVVFDIAIPLVAYGVLRSAGLTTVTALVLSGVVPAVGVAVGVVRHRHLDVVGALVLAGIAVGAVPAWSAMTPGWCWSRARWAPACSAWRALAHCGRGAR